MKLSELTKALKRVSPALSNKDFSPILECFCFDGETVTAHDDVVTMQAPCELPVKGGVRGKILLDFLSACRVKEVSLESPSEDEILLKAGRAKLKMPMLPEEDFLHDLPGDKSGASYKKSPGAIAESVRRCVLTMSSNPSEPDRLGVVVRLSDKGMTLYSSDNFTATRAVLPKCTAKKKVTFALSPRFCDLLAQISGSDEVVRIQLSREWGLAEFKSGVRLFSKNTANADTDSFDKLFKDAAESEGDLIDVPKSLQRALQRHLVLMAGVDDSQRVTEARVAKERLNLHTSTTFGEAKDIVKMPGHGDVTVHLLPDLLLKCLAGSDKLAIVEDRFVVLDSGTHQHIVTVRATPEDAADEAEGDGDE